MEEKFIPLNDYLTATAREATAKALEKSNNRTRPEYVVLSHTDTLPEYVENVGDSETLELYKKYKSWDGKWPVFGFNCINTVTSDYGHPVTRNGTFHDDPWKYGFRKIKDEETLPGDIVQFWGQGKHVPSHAMIAVTPYTKNPKEMRFNGAAGTPVTFNVIKNLPATMADSWDRMVSYRYVGTPKEQQVWTDAWRTKYQSPDLISSSYTSPGLIGSVRPPELINNPWAYKMPLPDLAIKVPEGLVPRVVLPKEALVLSDMPPYDKNISKKWNK